MNVYVIIENDPSLYDYQEKIIGVCSTYEIASEIIDYLEKNSKFKYIYSIEKHIVDAKKLYA